MLKLGTPKNRSINYEAKENYNFFFCVFNDYS
nr:MAG TPA: hypothetical protein [Caudoviricetes sp.]